MVANGINGGQWGYNNLQWYGVTYYHKFNDQWHISFEVYNEHQNNVPNAINPAALAAFAAEALRSRLNIMPFNSPGLAQCNSAAVLSCTARRVQTLTYYLNYKASPLDNISYRVEYL